VEQVLTHRVARTDPDPAIPDEAMRTRTQVRVEACLNLLDEISKGDVKDVAAAVRPLDDSAYPRAALDLTQLFTSDAHHYLHGALFAHPRALEQALELGKPLLDKCKSKVGGSLASFKESWDDWAKGEQERIAQEAVDMRKKEPKPEPQWPLELCINSRDHFAHFTQNMPRRSVLAPEPKQEGVEMCHSDGLDPGVPDDVLMLLHLGVGIYAPYHEQCMLWPKYTSKVVDLANRRRLAFVVADSHIAYGTNLPFSNVLISPEFAASTTLNTLSQLIGRAGRVGRSEYAQVVLLDEKTRQRIMCLDEATANVEAQILREAFSRAASWQGGYTSPGIPEEEAAVWNWRFEPFTEPGLRLPGSETRSKSSSPPPRE